MGHRGDNSRGSLGNREGWKAGSDLALDVAWVGEEKSSREDRACARFRLQRVQAGRGGSTEGMAVCPRADHGSEHLGTGTSQE